ncbi:transposase [Burkholderia ubonensis]|uniref:transposase n=1 Tax=Burkholderia ubonensis TaxID=101571 RepID=UPI001E28B447|nr:transposase [Burkholderia ubonensis]
MRSDHVSNTNFGMSVAVRQFVAGNAKRLPLIRLPGYCPGLNPDERLNQDATTNALCSAEPSNQQGREKRHRPSASALPAG